MNWKILYVLPAFLLTYLSLGAQSILDTKVDIIFSGKTIGNILLELEEQTGLRFFFRTEWLPSGARSFEAGQKTLAEALELILDGTGLAFTDYNDQGIIVARESDLAREYSSAFYTTRYEIYLDEAEKIRPDAGIVIIGDSTNVDRDGVVRINGKITDRYTGEPLVGVTLLVEESGTGVVSEPDGSYRLDLPPGSHFLTIQTIGYREVYKQFEVYSDEKYDIKLDVKSFQLEEVVIKGNAGDQNVKAAQIGIKELSIREIREIPSFLGEADVIKGLLTLPGVSTVGEGAGGFNVRGGNIDQNLIMQDGALVFNSSHVLGFFSIFNSDAIEKVTLYKGNIPAQYGGRISSVLDVRTKEGNYRKLKGSVGVGLIASRIAIEGPLFKNRTSFLLSARSSYSDWVLRRVNVKEVRESAASFYDLNAKLSQRIGTGTFLSATFYRSDDFFRFSDQFGYEWNTDLYTFEWRQIYSPQLSSATTAVAGQYHSEFFQPEGQEAFRLANGMKYFKVKHNFFYSPRHNHKLNAGAEWIRYDGRPESLKPNGELSVIIPDRVDKEQALEWGFYINDEVILNRVFSVSLGLRYSLFRNTGPGKVFSYRPEEPLDQGAITDTLLFGSNELIRQYDGFEPRISLKISLGDNSSVKLSYNRLRQYIHLISNTTATTPVDIWQLSNRFLSPQTADNFSLGFFKNLKNNQWETAVELYYKKMSGLVEYKDFADLFLNDHLETEWLQARGRSFGLEASVNKKTGNWTGSFSYSYSRTQRKVRGPFPEETINNGKWFPSNFDKPHQLNLLAKYKPNKKRTLSFNFTYSTGRPTTVPVNSYIFGTVVVPNFSERNQFRIPDFHRLDIAYSVESGLFKRQGLKGSFSISIYNIYFRKNAFSVFFKRNPQKFFPEGFKLAVLGNAFPALSYNLKF